jgi:hypothetical protein
VTKSQKSLVSIAAVYAILVCLLSISSYLYARNEAVGGIMLGLTGTVVGILLPYHLHRTGVVSFRFIPETAKSRRVIVVSLAFAAFYLLVLPSTSTRWMQSWLILLGPSA